VKKIRLFLQHASSSTKISMDLPRKRGPPPRRAAPCPCPDRLPAAAPVLTLHCAGIPPAAGIEFMNFINFQPGTDVMI
jgi:hypothetical protein